MNLAKKITACSIAFLLACGSVVPTFAADSVGSVATDYGVGISNPTGQDTAQNKQSETQSVTASIGANTDRATDVYAHQDSTYSVVLPKVVILNGGASSNYSGSYAVSTEGNITGEQQLNITPDSTLSLSQVNKADVSASVSQNKTTFTYDEMGDSTTGTITSNVLTAGPWHGNFNFNVSLGTIEVPETTKTWDVSYDNDNSVILTYDTETKIAEINASDSNARMAEIDPILAGTKDYQPFIDFMDAFNNGDMDRATEIYENDDLIQPMFQGNYFMFPAETLIIRNKKTIDTDTIGGITTLKNVIVCDGTETIAMGFLDMRDKQNSLESVTLPSSVTSIHVTNCFRGCSNLTMRCVQGSYADTYAQQHSDIFTNIEYI